MSADAAIRLTCLLQSWLRVGEDFSLGVIEGQVVDVVYCQVVFVEEIVVEEGIVEFVLWTLSLCNFEVVSECGN